MWQWAPVNTFTDPKIPPNEYAGENPPYGAIVTYYLARAPKAASITILDSTGRAVRHLKGDDVPKRAGMNRAAWDLNEDGPVTWTGTFEENRGPDTGPEAVPGTFTVELSADGISKSQPLTVKPDPRDDNLAQSRHAFLTEVYADLSAVDTMLNALDARIKHSPAQSQAARLRAFERRLTYAPRNIEDLNGPAQLREKLLDLISRMSTSFQAPTEAQRAALESYKAELDALAAEYPKL